MCVSGNMKFQNTDGSWNIILLKCLYGEDRETICPNRRIIIRIVNGCEVLTENFVMRVTVWHHEACRVMPNSYPSD